MPIKSSRHRLAHKAIFDFLIDITNITYITIIRFRAQTHVTSEPIVLYDHSIYSIYMPRELSLSPQENCSKCSMIDSQSLNKKLNVVGDAINRHTCSLIDSQFLTFFFSILIFFLLFKFSISNINLNVSLKKKSISTLDPGVDLQMVLYYL